MKIINSLILLLMVLMMTSSVLAACPSNMVSYWNFDDSMDDDFNDNSLDSTIWTTEGSGSTSETGGKLNFASTSAGGQVISGAKNTALLKGDFDVQVDFSDLSGLTNSWDVAWLYVYTGDWSTGYSAYIGREYRGSQRMLSNVRKVGVDSETAVANSQTSGSYRITRSGSTVNIYYDNSGWQLLKTDSSFTTADLNVKLDLILQNTGSASIKFDNFKIVNGEPTTDSDGNNDGIISGATSTTGQLGSALDFDGSDDYVEVTGDPIGSYPYSISAGKNMSFSWDDIKLKQRNLNVLWNVHNYVLDLDTQIDKAVQPAETGIEEKYILSRLNSTLKEVTEKLDKYLIDEVIEVMESFFLDVSRVYIQMTRDKVNESMESKILVYNTIKKCMLETIKMFSVVTPYVMEEMYLNLKDLFSLDAESVHMLDWSEYDEGMIDVDLEKSMEFGGQIIQSALASREKAKLSLRWPVKEIIVSTEDPFMEDVVKILEPVLKKQINTKEIIVKEFTDVNYSVALNFRNAGKKFGTETGDVAVGIKDVNGSDVFNAIEKDGKFMLLDKFELTKDEVNFEKEVPENMTCSEFSKGTVYLNIERTEELDREGYAREVMRRVQDLRKQSGLEKNDVIKLHIKSSLSLEGFEDRIKKTCGASELTISDEGSEFSIKTEFEIKQNDFMIFFDKL